MNFARTQINVFACSWWDIYWSDW